MSFLILGARGQVGSAWLKILRARELPVIAWSRAEMDLENLEALKSSLQGLPEIRAVVNCAAFTGVDLAETQREKARILNEEVPRALAQWCEGRVIPLIHYSTEFVFDGKGSAPYREDDATHPLNWYGETKRRGEWAVAQTGARHLILRASWIYDFSARNFLSSILRLAREKETLEVVEDQVGAPTYAQDLAQASFEALQNAEQQASDPSSYPSGIYHLCHRGEVSRYDFARILIERARELGLALQVKEVRPIAAADFPTPAQRPLNSRMSTEKIEKILKVSLPSWQEGLRHCLEAGLS